MKNLAFCVLLASMAVQTHAAEKAWKQEPTAVFGVKLGAPLYQSGLPACAPRDYSGPTPPAMPTSLCLEGNNFDPSFYMLLGTPDVGFQQETAIWLRRESVARIELRFSNDQFGQVISVLRERYGAPSESRVTTVTTQAGATLQSRVVSWTGARTRIVAEERSVRIDRGTVFFTDLGLESEAQRSSRDAAKRGAGNL